MTLANHEPDYPVEAEPGEAARPARGKSRSIWSEFVMTAAEEAEREPDYPRPGEEGMSWPASGLPPLFGQQPTESALVSPPPPPPGQHVQPAWQPPETAESLTADML